LFKVRQSLVMADVPLFGVGFLFSFLAAWVCIRWLIRYVSTHSFVAFAWYRIAFGILILATAYFNLVVWKD
jgi:undecaprenyl-diphosphatase